MKPLILFDIDRTLFDTKIFIQTIRHKFLSYLNITPQKFDKIFSKYYKLLAKHADYNPEEFIKHIINSLNLSKQPKIYEKLHNLYFSSENFSTSLYPETLPVLKDLKIRYILGIFSEGVLSFQKTKLIKSGLLDLLSPEHLFIHTRKTTQKEISSLPAACTIIDDNPLVVTELANQKNTVITPIWLNRKDKSTHPRARTIHFLTELN